MDTRLKDGTSYFPAYNWEPGMNDELAYADRAGYNTSVEMLTSGVAEDAFVFGGLEVGNAYDMDPSGEARSMMTFPADDAKGIIGKLGTESAGIQDGITTTVGGKRANLSSPQTYNKIAMSKKSD